MEHPIVLGDGALIAPLASEDDSTYALGDTITLTLQNLGSFDSLRWVLRYSPDGSECVISAATGASITVGPLDVAGRYTVRCIGRDADGILVGSQSVFLYARDTRGLRFIAQNEDIRENADEFRAELNRQNEALGVVGRVVSVAAFGAVGDDVTNDSAAFALAMAACLAGDGSLYIPAGSYRVDAQTFSSAWAGRTVYGDGAGLSILKLRGAGSALVTLQASGMVFDRLTLDGFSNATAAVVEATSGSRTVFRTCAFKNGPCAARMNGGSFSLEGCDVTGLTSEAVLVEDTAPGFALWRITASSALTVPFLKQTAGATTSKKPIHVLGCDVETSASNAMVLTCQQPVVLMANTHYGNLSVTPTATYGTQRITSMGNAWVDDGEQFTGAGEDLVLQMGDFYA